MLLVASRGSLGHVGDRLFSAYELTDADLEVINIQDGMTEDWQRTVGPPTLTTSDLSVYSGLPDPASFEARVWIGWHGASSRVFLAVERADDEYVNDYRGTTPNTPDFLYMVYWDTGIWFAVDGDHTAGKLYYSGSEGLSYEEWLVAHNRVAQGYDAIGVTYDGSRRLRTWLHGQYNVWWYTEPPLAGVGGAVYSESPTITVTEMYVTAFDELVYNAPAESARSDLHANQVIGFKLVVGDRDRRGLSIFGVPQPSSAPGSRAEEFADLILLPSGFTAQTHEEGSGFLESASWARVKEAGGIRGISGLSGKVGGGDEGGSVGSTRRVGGPGGQGADPEAGATVE